MKTVVCLPKNEVAELSRCNEILLLTKGPGGSESAMAKEYFPFNHTVALQAIKVRMQHNGTARATNCNLLIKVAQNVED